MRSCAVFSFFVVSVSLCAQTGAPQYTVTNIGVLASPGLVVSQATGLNNSGTVIGFSATEPFPMFAGEVNSLHAARGWMYSNGALTDLDAADTTDQLMDPIAINDSSLVMVLKGPETASSAYFLQNGQYSRPSTFPGASLPVGLNDAGEVSGTLFIESQPGAFTWGSNTLLKLPAGNGVQNSLGFGVSSTGVVAGGLAGGASDIFAATWAPGAAPSFVSNAGSNLGESLALSINSSGTAAGLLFNGGMQTEAAIFTSDAVTGIGVYPGAMASVATSINESGVVVGFSVLDGIDSSKFFSTYFDPAALVPPLQSGRAFVYIGGVMYDLTALVNDARWVFAYAAAINDSGQIAGTGFFNGVQTAFLLTPQGGANTPIVAAAVGAGLSSPSVTAVSPGGLFAIFGASLTSEATPVSVGSSTIVDGALPTNLAGTCVEVDGVPAPLTYVSATQINAEAPQLSTSGFASVVVISNCGTGNEIFSVPFSVGYAAQSPEFLYWGSSEVIAEEYPSNAYVASPNLIPGLTTAPAHFGDVLILYPIGLGATSPAVAPGVLATGVASLSGTYGVTIGGVPVPVLYAGVAPGYSGLYQINLTVPSGLAVPAGTTALLPIVVTVNGTSSPSSGVIAIAN